MDGLSFISAVASCKKLNSEYFDIFSQAKQDLQRDRWGENGERGGSWKMVWAQPSQQKAWHMYKLLRGPDLLLVPTLTAAVGLANAVTVHRAPWLGRELCFTLFILITFGCPCISQTSFSCLDGWKLLE